jgi:YfiH family protein
VRAVTTTRLGGASHAPYESFNLATHVGDDASQVDAHRQALLTHLGLTMSPCWLEQVHSNKVVKCSADTALVKADASVSHQSQRACVVMTADCLPVLFCDRQGTVVAAAHAGWRGLASGILEATIDTMQVVGCEVMAWLGPAIGAQAYEVGDEVRDAFVQIMPDAEAAFEATRPGHWLMDIYQLATQRLQSRGVTQIYGGEFCTFSDSRRFYSFRRDGVTGRMASLIWLQV